MFVHLCSSLFIDGRFLFQLHGLEGCGNRQPDLARFGNFCNFSRLKLVNLLSRLGDRFLRIAWYDMVCTCMILYDTNLLSCTSPDLSCTPPAPLLTPAAPLFPAPLQQKLEGFPKDTSNHFKTNAKLCKAFLCFYIELSDVITCWACMAPLLTSPAPLLHLSWPLLHPSCTSPDPCCASLPCTSPAEVRRLSERHFKPFQNKCEAMQSFYVLLCKAIRCGYVLGLPHAPLLHLSWPLLHLSLLHLSSRS